MFLMVWCVCAWLVVRFTRKNKRQPILFDIYKRINFLVAARNTNIDQKICCIRFLKTVDIELASDVVVDQLLRVQRHKSFSNSFCFFYFKHFGRSFCSKFFSIVIKSNSNEIQFLVVQNRNVQYKALSVNESTKKNLKIVSNKL